MVITYAARARRLSHLLALIALVYLALFREKANAVWSRDDVAKRQRFA